MKSKFKGRLMAAVSAILLITFIVISTVCYIAVSKNIHKDEYISGEAAASFAAVEINGDKSRFYITTRKTDGEYQEVMRNLLEYTRDCRISRISVISYGSTVGYYIYDTDGKQIGTKISYDDYTSSVKSQLVEARESWSRTKGDVNYTYRPLRTSDDLAVGYIVVETNVSGNNIPVILLMVALISVVLIILASFAIMLIMKKYVFNPIGIFASAAAEFTGSESEDDHGEELKKKFETGRSDEIGHLGQSLISMINVINHSRENFSTAVFDATHDGMTKTYNKRHYETKVDSFRKCSSICVIYFDVNNLKLINDTLGHERGDYVIKRAAEYIREVSFDDSMCFRMGGDEFLLVVINRSYRDIYSLINRLDSDCPVILSAETDSVKCSIAYGYAYEKGNYSYEKLLGEAEENMYRKKYEIKQQLNMPDR